MLRCLSPWPQKVNSTGAPFISATEDYTVIDAAGSLYASTCRKAGLKKATISLLPLPCVSCSDTHWNMCPTTMTLMAKSWRAWAEPALEKDELCTTCCYVFFPCLQTPLLTTLKIWIRFINCSCFTIIFKGRTHQTSLELVISKSHVGLYLFITKISLFTISGI